VNIFHLPIITIILQYCAYWLIIGLILLQWYYIIIFTNIGIILCFNVSNNEKKIVFDIIKFSLG
jgi:hypothetical protein